MDDRSLSAQVGPGRWFFDFGTELMGGLSLTVRGGAEGQRLDIRLSEELTGPHTILYPMRTGNKFQELWTLGPGPTSAFENHEYRLFRYGEITSADTPVPPACPCVMWSPALIQSVPVLPRGRWGQSPGAMGAPEATTGRAGGRRGDDAGTVRSCRVRKAPSHLRTPASLPSFPLPLPTCPLPKLRPSRALQRPPASRTRPAATPPPPHLMTPRAHSAPYSCPTVPAQWYRHVR